MVILTNNDDVKGLAAAEGKEETQQRSIGEEQFNRQQRLSISFVKRETRRRNF